MSGGLGNQIFQFAAGKYIELHLNRFVLYNVANLMHSARSEIGNYTREYQLGELLTKDKMIFSRIPLRADMPIRFFRRLINPRSIVLENQSSKNPLSQIDEKTIAVYGYFQDYKLIEFMWDDLESSFKKSPTFNRFIDIEKENQIACHLRFGDYSDDPSTKSFHGLTKASYFKQAISELSVDFEGRAKVSFVTDDPIQAESFIEKLDIDLNFKIFSSANLLLDLHEIAKSTHVVIGNSTFAWWGAWLAFKSHKAKIIYPRPWFADRFDPDLPIYVPGWKSLKRDFYN